jgi:RNA 3'-terminal phosphate cyclase-like protein
MFSQECPPERSIGYYLEPLLALGPFCKTPLNVTLTGVTNNQSDPSVDLVKASSLPALKRFLLGKYFYLFDGIPLSRRSLDLQ